MKPYLLAGCIASIFIVSRGLSEEAVALQTDICVYGGTASGVMAAVAASKQGASVILVEPSRWLGGMTGGGIDYLDWGREAAVGGATYKFLTDGLDNFHDRTHGEGSTYARSTRVGHSNRIYRERFLEWVREQGIQVIYDHRLGGISKDGVAIRSITLDHAPVDETGCPVPVPKKKAAVTIAAKVFIDCSYEGDLLAMSGTTYTWGRESRDEYGESLAGVRPDLWVYEIDPFKEEGKPESGLIPHVTDLRTGSEGSADKLTMGYCFRYKFNFEGEGLALPTPTNYDPADFELFRRAMRDGVDIYTEWALRQLDQDARVTNFKPGGAPDLNPRLFHGNLSRCLMTHTIYGSNTDYPDGDWRTRSKIWKFHQDFLVNFTHFLKVDPVVPESLRKQAENLRFQPGDFDETGGWPHQFYVREARRMVADYVVTQSDLEAETRPEHPIGLASYGVDDWSYATVAREGKVALQGGEFSILYLDQGKQNGSYAIPYESIVPGKGECTNLLVPVCCSASHIAMTSIRMEPVWMILGESAGVAAALAVEDNIAVQDVPYAKLRPRLLKLGQKLDVLPPDGSFRSAGNKHGWASQTEWDREKEGYEWVFPLIDSDKDGKVDAEEYGAFQLFKKTHDNWEEALRR